MKTTTGSFQMVEYVEKRCGSLTDAQRKQLSVNMDDIIFVLPEDVSVVFDQFGEPSRWIYADLKFCFRHLWRKKPLDP